MSRLNQIEGILKKLSQPPFRLNQLLNSIYKENTLEYSKITNLPKELRQIISDEFGDQILTLKPVSESKGRQVHKVLFETKDGERVEAVRMTYYTNAERGHKLDSLCVSSQSGCAMGCKFCATGALGLKKNLTEDEIVDQVLWFTKQGIHINNIIFMGMGEPFSNADEVFKAIHTLTDPKFVGMSPRKISVSTVGVVPGIERLMREFPNVNLALSLHSPFEEERTEIMPVTKAYSIKKVMEAVSKHVQTTNNKVFISYLVLGGINDTAKHAESLVKLIRNQGPKSYLYHVNLIMFNPGPTIGTFKRANPETVRKFKEILDSSHIGCTIRKDFGVEIDAACGQLYAKYSKKQ